MSTLPHSLRRPPWVTLLLSAWALSVALTVLTAFTPLELAPMWLGNVPHWGLWFLALPACSWLRAHRGRLRWLWRAVPWLLWVPLALITGFKLWRNYDSIPPGWDPYQPTVRWHNVFYPLEMTFANTDNWRTRKVIVQEGIRVVSLEYQLTRYGQTLPYLTTNYHLLPGLRWATRRNVTYEELMRYDP